MRLIGFRSMILSLLALLALGGCSSTKFVETWDNDQYQGAHSFQKVLIVGMFKDVVTRRFFEEHFAAVAQEQGLNAVASVDYFPQPTDHDQRKELVEKIRQVGADAVLVAQMKSIEKVAGSVPDQIDWYPDGGFYDYGLYDYYYQSYRAIYRPGYIASDTYVRMQVRLFSVDTEQLVWAGNLITKNPKTIVGTIEAIADKVIGEIQGGFSL